MNPVVFRGAEPSRPSIDLAVEALLGDAPVTIGQTTRHVVQAMNAIAKHREERSSISQLAPYRLSQLAFTTLTDAQCAGLLNAGVERLNETLPQWVETDSFGDVVSGISALGHLVGTLKGLDSSTFASFAEDLMRHANGRQRNSYPGLIRCMRGHAICLAQVGEIAHADAYELSLTTKHAWYRPSRRPTWVKAEHHSAALPNTEEFARRVIGVMIRNDRAASGYSDRTVAFAQSCDLDWLPKDLAYKIALAPNRPLSGWNATKEDVINTIRPVLGSGDSGRLAAECVSNMTGLAAFDELVADLEAIELLFRGQHSLSKLRPSDNALYTSPPEVTVAKMLPEQAMLVAMGALREVAIKDFAHAPADHHQEATRLAHLIAQTSVVGYAKSQNDHLSTLLMSEPFQNRLKTLGKQGFIAGDTLMGLWSHAGHTYKDDEQTCRLLSMIVDSGLISLGRLDKSCLHESIVGPALERTPERLAEVYDIRTFVTLARRHKIPVQIPDNACIPHDISATMKKTIAAVRASSSATAGDMLAGVGEEQRKPRARRKP
ncbi:hypothetical protein ABIC83_002804 [Roseateles asaccharophilus]|uniref:hypothetical protein n=1 Tax=Roseateles asaccharophilus TaxID=582607 RepID=UPI0038342998